MEFADLPSEIRSRLVSLALNHPGTSAIDMFSEIPQNLRDSISEIKHWMDTQEWSHIIPKSMGGVEAVWETKVGHPNQVRGDQPMTILEQLEIKQQNYEDSTRIEALHSDDISPEAFDQNAGQLISEWSASLEQALVGAGLVGVSGYAVAFAFRIARNVIAHRDELIRNREFRKSFLAKTFEQAHTQGIRAGALAFIVSFICIIFPPFKFLLMAGAIVGIGRLGLEILYSTIRHVDPLGISIISKVFDFGRQAFNIAASILAVIWAGLNVVVDWIVEGLKKVANVALRIGKKVFNTIAKMMDWLLGAPTIASSYE